MIRSRLCEHADGEVRQAAVTAAFPPVKVLEVWPVGGDPFTGEWQRARSYARGQGRVCWVDGVVLG